MTKLNQEFDFWKITEIINGAEDLTLVKTGVWQTAPYQGVKISESEYMDLKKRHHGNKF